MSSISGGISFNGLGSDSLDYDAIIKQEKSIKSIQKNRLTAWKADWQTRYDAFDGLLTNVQTLYDKLSDMSASSNFLQKKSSVLDPSVISVTTTSKAVDGQHSIKVDKLATNAVLTNNHIFSSVHDNVTGAGQPPRFSYTYNGQSRSIDIANNCELELLVTKINADQNNPGVIASLVPTDDGYIFMLQGKDTGKDAQITINSDTNLPLFMTENPSAIYYEPRRSLVNDPAAKLNTTGATYLYQIAKQDGSGTVDLEIDPTTTAAGLAAKINALASQTGIAATLDQNPTQGYDLNLTYTDSTGNSSPLTDLTKFVAQNAKPLNNTSSASASPAFASLMHFASTTEAVNTTGNDATFMIQGKAYAVKPGQTVSDLVNTINQDTATTGVKASLVTENGKSYLQLEEKNGNNVWGMSTSSNAAGELGNGLGTLTTQWSSPKTLDPNQMGMKTVRKAESAQYHLDGIDQTFTSSSNIVKPLDGIEITLLAENESTSFTISTSMEDTKSKIEDFVKAYNELVVGFDAVDKYDEDKEVKDRSVSKDEDGNYVIDYSSQFAYQKGGVLTGNYGLQTVRSEIKQLISSRGAGFRDRTSDTDKYGERYTSLASIGIILDSDESSSTFGQLKFMTENERVNKGGSDDKNNPYRTLDMALAEDPQAVINLLVGSGGATDDTRFSYRGSLGGSTAPKPGEYDVSYTIDTVGVPPTSIQINGVTATLDSNTNTYTVPPGNDISGVEIAIDDLSTLGAVNGHVRIKQGKIGQLADQLKEELHDEPIELAANNPDYHRGTLITLKANYKTIMENIDSKISDETKRIQTWETRERLKYSRLDTLLGNYNNQMTSNSAQFAQLGNNS